MTTQIEGRTRLPTTTITGISGVRIREMCLSGTSRRKPPMKPKKLVRNLSFSHKMTLRIDFNFYREIDKKELMEKKRSNYDNRSSRKNSGSQGNFHNDRRDRDSRRYGGIEGDKEEKMTDSQRKFINKHR